MSFRTYTLRRAILLAAIFTAFLAADADSDWKARLAAAVQARNTPQFAQLFQLAVQAAAAFPPGDARIGITYNALGLIYQDQKKYDDAVKAFEKALAIVEKAFGADSLDAGNVSFNLASTLVAGFHYEEALPYILRSRSVYVRALGAESLKTASTYCMAANVYQSQKKFFEAESALKQCADAREAAAGVESAEFADALFSLALVYQHEGKLAMADSTLKLTEKIREIALGVTSPELADALEAHAAILRQIGRNDDATKEEAMAAAIRRHVKR